MTEELTEAEIGARKNPIAPRWGAHYGIYNLWDEVAPGLWVGGTDDTDTLAEPRNSWQSMQHGTVIDDDAEITPAEFDAVITMYAWARPVDWGVTELRWHIYDSDEEFPRDDLADVVEWGWRRWKAGKRVLCRCQAGLNRSSLVAAGILIRDGKTTAEAIDTIRSGRSYRCLFNKSFVGELVALEGVLRGD